MLVLGSIPVRPLAAQGSTLRVVVTDSLDRGVPFAWVQLARGASRVANDSGVVQFGAVAEDSIRFVARRIGYHPFDAWVKRSPDGAYRVLLVPLPRSLVQVDITERANTPLARTGFYDRMERVQRGAISARFITPEEIELRNPTRISNMLAGESMVKLQLNAGRAILLGRGGSCGMTILVDRVRLTGMVEEAYTFDGQEKIRRMGGSWQATQQFLQERQSIDDVVTSLSVAAIEIYATAASAPAELQRVAGPTSCGIIALWTGSRH